MPKKKLLSKTRQILKIQNRTASNLSLVFVNDKLIKKLNKEFLRKNRPTDVMAFDLKDRKESKNIINGEIVISTETAIKNAKIYKTSHFEEILLYLIHGILHLCGFRDNTKREIQRMRQREQYILNKIT